MRNTVKSGTDISFIFDKGRRYSTPYLTLIVLENQHDPRGRVAFIAGKKLGNAVWRTTAKRRMRGVCRDLGGLFSGYDVIFLAKKRIENCSYREMYTSTEKALIKAGIATA